MEDSYLYFVCNGEHKEVGNPLQSIVGNKHYLYKLPEDMTLISNDNRKYYQEEKISDNASCTD